MSLYSFRSLNQSSKLGWKSSAKYYNLKVIRSISFVGKQSDTIIDERDALGRSPGWRIPEGKNEIEKNILHAEHPILLNKDLDTYRPGFFDPPRPWWTIWERISLPTRRKSSARNVIDKFVNNHPKDIKDDHFFYPTRVEPGFKEFVPHLLEDVLSGWDGVTDNPELRTMTTDALYDRLVHSHLAYKAHGLVPLFTILDKDTDFKTTKMTLEDCWLTKGLFSTLESSSPVSIRDSFNISSVLFDGASVDREVTKISSNRPNGQNIVGIQVGLNMKLQTTFFNINKLSNKEELLKPENKSNLIELLKSKSKEQNSSLIDLNYTIQRKFIFRFDSHPFLNIIDRRFKLSDIDRQIESEVAERDEAIFTIKPDEVEI